MEMQWLKGAGAVRLLQARVRWQVRGGVGLEVAVGRRCGLACGCLR